MKVSIWCHECGVVTVQAVDGESEWETVGSHAIWHGWVSSQGFTIGGEPVTDDEHTLETLAYKACTQVDELWRLLLYFFVMCLAEAAVIGYLLVIEGAG